MKRRPHGGARTGAGRKYKYGVPLVTKRIPQSGETELEDALEKLLAETSKVEGNANSKFPNIRHSVELPLYSGRIEAGEPTHLDAEIEEYIDINDYLGTSVDTDYFLRVSGESMIDAGINPDDIVSVQKAKHAKNGDIVVALVDGGITLKRYVVENGKELLRSENRTVRNFSENLYQERAVIGIVRSVSRRL